LNTTNRLSELRSHVQFTADCEPKQHLISIWAFWLRLLYANLRRILLPFPWRSYLLHLSHI